MSIRDHAWGISNAADRLWSLVVGFGSARADARLLMFLACIDDSEDHEGGSFVLAGYIATAENWGKFTTEWEALVATDGVYDEPGGARYFKMKRMNRSPRLERVEGFYRIIEKYAHAALSCHFNMHELEKAKRRVYAPGVALDLSLMDKHVFAYRALLDMFHSHRDKFTEAIPIDENVDFIFDIQKSADKFLNDWSQYMALRPKHTAPFYGARPIPRDDKDFMPLQAADFWAWWVRKWHKDGVGMDVEGWHNFGPFREERVGFLKLHLSFTEDQIVKTFMNAVADGIRPFQTVVDLGWANGLRGMYGRKTD